MRKPRILIVEDEAIIAMDIEEALLSLNYDVAGKTTSGEEALEIMDKLEPAPDLVLMDIHLAGEIESESPSNDWTCLAIVSRKGYGYVLGLRRRNAGWKENQSVI